MHLGSGRVHTCGRMRKLCALGLKEFSALQLRGSGHRSEPHAARLHFKHEKVTAVPAGPLEGVQAIQGITNEARLVRQQLRICALATS